MWHSTAEDESEIWAESKTFFLLLFFIQPFRLHRSSGRVLSFCFFFFITNLHKVISFPWNKRQNFFLWLLTIQQKQTFGFAGCYIMWVKPAGFREPRNLPDHDRRDVGDLMCEVWSSLGKVNTEKPATLTTNHFFLLQCGPQNLFKGQKELICDARFLLSVVCLR